MGLHPSIIARRPLSEDQGKERLVVENVPESTTTWVPVFIIGVPPELLRWTATPWLPKASPVSPAWSWVSPETTSSPRRLAPARGPSGDYP